jgi:hypothetical protein
VIPELLLREWRPQDVLGNRAPALCVVRTDADRVVEAESRMPPPKELPDDHLVDASLLEEHPKDPVAEEVFGGVEVDFREGVEPPI